MVFFNRKKNQPNPEQPNPEQRNPEALVEYEKNQKALEEALKALEKSFPLKSGPSGSSNAEDIQIQAIGPVVPDHGYRSAVVEFSVNNTNMKVQRWNDGRITLSSKIDPGEKPKKVKKATDDELKRCVKLLYEMCNSENQQKEFTLRSVRPAGCEQKVIQMLLSDQQFEHVYYEGKTYSLKDGLLSVGKPSSEQPSSLRETSTSTP